MRKEQDKLTTAQATLLLTPKISVTKSTHTHTHTSVRKRHVP